MRTGKRSVAMRVVGVGGALGAVVLVAVSMSLAKTPGSVWIVRPGCNRDCQLFDIYGKRQVLPSAGSVATPIGTTYSVFHLVGADLEGEGVTTCFSIADEPPPGAEDDIVTYDGIPEDVRTDILGTVPTVVEDTTDNADGTHLLVVDTSSPQGTELFPGGFFDLESGKELTDACYWLGLPDPLDWEGMDSVIAASISYLSDGSIVVDPVDVTEMFSDPWDGVFAVVLVDGAGAGINGVRLEILVEKMSPDPIGACCVNGECIGDILRLSCEFQGGHWHYGASCGQNPDLPPPVCEQTACSFNNGLPLDDAGAPASQYAPDEPFAAGAVDDFILSSPGDNPCRIDQIRAWIEHFNSPGGDPDPNLHYQGVNVTVYANTDPRGPGGEPEDDGTHLAYTYSGIRYTQTIPMSAITATPLSPGPCLDNGLWQLDIPVDIILSENDTYWLEVQPIMSFEDFGQTAWLLSTSNNGHRAQRIFRYGSITQWREISGNADACPQGSPPTPPAGTRTNLAFELFGEEIIGPPNDNCEDALPVEDGVISFTTFGATTDGPDEPEMCEFWSYTHIESDIWFDYPASCTGDLTVSLCGSEYDTKLAVYAGCGYCPPRGLPVACDEDAQMLFCSLQSELTLPVVEGDCYTIRIGGHRGAQGRGIMTVRCELPPPPTGACCYDGTCLGTMTESDCDIPDGEWFEGEDCATFICPVQLPPHDECGECIPVFTDEPYSNRTNHATGTDISDLCGTSDTADVWHCWTADCTGVATFNLCDSAYDTTVAVYDACGGNELDCNDDGCGAGAETQSLLELLVTEGATYYIRVSGHNGEVGNYTLIVESCISACCNTNGSICVLADPDVCSDFGWIPHEPGSVCLGDSDHNGIDDTCEQSPDAWFWKDYNGEDPGGYLPDFDQNQDYDNADGDADPTTGVDPFYCGPTAVANSLWWFHRKYPEAGVVPPGYTKLELIEQLATNMGTNGTATHPSPNGHQGPYAGTFIDDMQSGINAYLDDNGLTGLFDEHTVTPPPYEDVVNELTQGRDVTLLLGFYHVEDVDPIGDPLDGYVVHWRRTGGHYVTVAGVDPMNDKLAISDPDADMAEEGAPGVVRGGDHDHDGDGNPDTALPFRDPGYDHTEHNDESLASHDFYEAMPSFTPGETWILAVDGDPLAYAELLASFHKRDAGGEFDVDSTFVTLDFLDQNGYPHPAVCQTYTAVEHAVVVSPLDICPNAQIATAQPPDGTVDARQPHENYSALPRQGIGSPGGQGSDREPIVIVLDPPVTGAEGCFVLCETMVDPLLGDNSVASVIRLTDGSYEIVLDHAITTGAVTTIEYKGDGSFVEYTSHPANVNSDGFSSALDILAVIDILNGTVTSSWGIYSEDIDHSSVAAPADILRVIDLLNGADEFESWLGVTRPENTTCP
ncbi:MAG: hypothetical protein WBE26_05480 [Phycisphaerae bacterium]